ncbi:MAG: Kef family K(+) transporter [Methylobacterium sp.]|nr:Kef family K(+) transporter [Methylobacterium sp.]MCA3604859.1 Kef family K(+) transporter [Methylobacterium sp.]MCA3615944.1 Kef family K(+) transporter [Methylobacterium sp.]MCA4908863.1 Kef family K(+) transporter [Methylobacterium sp.]
MQHDTPLIATIAVGLGLAFVLGVLAQRFRLPPIAGYLVAGILVGPFTPGFVADQKLAVELAEIGVILLMFGVGLHFSLKDLLSVRAIAVPGALGQIAVATMLGMGLASMMGWGMGAGLVFGLALSVASTVVLLRALQERRQVETEKGRIAVGWLIVEDLVMVVTLVLVPPLAALLGGKAPAEMASPGLAALLGVGPVWSTLLITAAKLGLFVTSMLVFGRKLIPWMLHYVAHTGSRELFRLAVLAIALGVAFGSAKLFGVSFALGAFFAGMVLAESPLSHQAAKETLPLRDAFAVLFFVSVGMLLDPRVLANHPFAVIATFLIITVGKSVAAYLIVRAFGYSNGVAMTISASLAQIGEFSFILIVLAVQLAIVPQAASDFVVAGSILSILVNPLMFLTIDRIYSQRATGKAPVAPAAPPAPPEEEEPTRLTDHAVLVGHGRVGSRLRADLQARGIAHLVVEEEAETVEALKTEGVEAFLGPCGEPAMLERLNLAGARYLISAIPDAFEAGHLVEAAKAANPGIWVVARAHSAEAVEYLRKVGADKVLMGEEELAKGMAAALG